ncbi:hypothetical protein HID58_063284, partial [Brassica napus]
MIMSTHKMAPSTSTAVPSSHPRPAAGRLAHSSSTTRRHYTISSVRNVNNWSGAVWITPIAGAYIADSYIGCFWTFTASSLIYV